MPNNLIYCEKDGLIIQCDHEYCDSINGTSISHNQFTMFKKLKLYQDNSLLLIDNNNNFKTIDQAFLENIEYKDFWRRY